MAKIPRAPESHTTPRRPLFRSAAALLGAAFLLPASQGATSAAPPSAPSGAAGDDAELVRLCGLFDATERQVIALHYGPSRIEDDDERSVALEPLVERQEALLDNIVARRAVALEGHLARAATLALFAPEIISDAERDGYMDQRLLGALLRDLVAQAPTPVVKEAVA